MHAASALVLRGRSERKALLRRSEVTMQDMVPCSCLGEGASGINCGVCHDYHRE